jgi:tetratricopeptide (TPR) repeat protein
MGVSRDPIVTSSFVKLRRVATGFDHLRGGHPIDPREERALRRVVRQLGATSLRLLSTELASPDESRAAFAHALLAEVGRSRALRQRIVGDLHATVRRPGAPDRAKLRAIALLAELDAELPAEAELSDPDAARRRSMSELAGCLGSPAEVARAADHLLAELPFDDILDLFDDLVDAEPAAALALSDELLVRDELDETCRHELRQRRASARQGHGRRQQKIRGRRAPAPRVRFARHRDGRRILLACARQPGSRPPRRRLMCLLVSADGMLLDGHYAEDMTTGAIERQFVDPLAEQGFDLAACGLDAARGFTIQSARIAIQHGRGLPRAFYVGRDLIGVRDEHLEGTPRARAEVDLAALLERAIDLLAAREPAQACPLLERYVAEAPDDPEGHAQLGICQLGLGDPAAALHHLGRAAWLDPDQAIYQWNIAAASHAAGRRGACYLALVADLDGADHTPGASERRATAARFIGEYERLAGLEHPDTSPGALAKAD